MQALTNKLDNLFLWISQMTAGEMVLYGIIFLIALIVGLWIARFIIGLFFTIVIAFIGFLFFGIACLFDRNH